MSKVSCWVKSRFWEAASPGFLLETASNAPASATAALVPAVKKRQMSVQRGVHIGKNRTKIGKLMAMKTMVPSRDFAHRGRQER